MLSLSPPALPLSGAELAASRAARALASRDVLVAGVAGVGSLLAVFAACSGSCETDGKTQAACAIKQTMIARMACCE